MSKREKIIVCLAVLAVLYGIYEYVRLSVTDDQSVEPKARLEETRKFAESIEKRLAEQQLTGPESYIIAHAGDEWTKDPFFSRPMHAKVDRTERKTGELTDFDLTYSGYLDTEGKKIAIINGFQYRPGETLHEGSLVLIKILPQRVVLRNRDTKRTIIVPLEEDV